MKFKCNNMMYEIIEVDEEELINDYIAKNSEEKREKIFIYGRTDYTKHTIKILKDLNQEEKIKTLKHELCHCWMWNTANSNQEEYNEEHICEIVAYSNDFINEVVNKYINKDNVLCSAEKWSILSEEEKQDMIAEHLKKVNILPC